DRSISMGRSRRRTRDASTRPDPPRSRPSTISGRRRTSSTPFAGRGPRLVSAQPQLDLAAEGREIRGQALLGPGVEATLELDDPRVQLGQLAEGVAGRRCGGSPTGWGIERADRAMGPCGDFAERGAEAGRVKPDVATPFDDRDSKRGLGPVN